MFATRIDPSLHKAIKILAVETEKAVSVLTEEAFKDLLKKYEKQLKK
jgi:predicted transcriptional regulator